MKKAIIAAAVLALAAPAATQAFAGHEGAIIKIDHKPKHRGKGHGKHKGWDDDRDEYRAYREGYREGRRDERYRQGYNQQYHHPGAVRYGYQRGYHLPQQYRGYVIEDYHEYDLYAPQYGQQWVGAGQNAYLIEAATGLILQVLQGRYR